MQWGALFLTFYKHNKIDNSKVDSNKNKVVIGRG
jgi:hypothetical protein